MQISAREIEQTIDSVREAFPRPQYVSSLNPTYYDIVNTVSRHVSKGARLLDFGSGPCDKAALLQRLGYDCAACDDLNDDWHLVPGVREAIEKFTADMGVEFQRTDGGPPAFEEASFDMVMVHHVLEHLHESPRELLNNLMRLVKPDGFLYATVPNAVNVRKRLAVIRGRTNFPDFEQFFWHTGSWRGHVREYVPDDLRSLSRTMDLELVELRGCDHMTHRREMSPIVSAAYRAVTAAFPFLKDSLSLVARKPADWRPIKAPQDSDRIRKWQESVCSLESLEGNVEVSPTDSESGRVVVNPRCDLDRDGGLTTLADKRMDAPVQDWQRRSTIDA